ncbi:MAG: 4Fe-4S ferredoxin [Fusobacteriota bacterium]
MKNWYPIINGKCDVCLACVVACPLDLLKKENGQIILTDSLKCPENCEKCKIMCPEDAISFYDGTQESLLRSFSGTCSCH